MRLFLVKAKLVQNVKESYRNLVLNWPKKAFPLSTLANVEISIIWWKDGLFDDYLMLSTPICIHYDFQKFLIFGSICLFPTLIFLNWLGVFESNWVPGWHPSELPKSDCSSRARKRARCSACALDFRRKSSAQACAGCCSFRGKFNNLQKPQSVAACCSERSERKQAATRWGVANYWTTSKATSTEPKELFIWKPYKRGVILKTLSRNERVF